MQIYADNAATTKVSDAAVRAMLPCFTEYYGNPSSVHAIGQQAAVILENARKEIAGLLHAQPGEIYFTSGGTEADNWAIRSAAAAGARKGKKHIISTEFEHHAVLHTLNKLENEGFEVTLLPVHADGIVRVEDLRHALQEDTALVSIMFANNEIGTVQPVAELAALCREAGVYFHTDAVQAVGHVPVDITALGVDMLSFSAHKFHGPKGVGALYCRKGVPLNTFMDGGAQERGRRGGTENLPAIAGMAAALAIAVRDLDKNAAYVSGMRNMLVEGLMHIPRTRCNSCTASQLPGIANLCFEGVEGEALLLLLDMQGICGSSGSACTSGSLDPSHVLLALGLPHEVAHGSLRLSLSEYNTPEEVAYILEKLPPIIERLREMSPVWERIQNGQEIV